MNKKHLAAPPRPSTPDSLSHHSLRHDMMQPAAIAMMMLESIRDRNQDESLKMPLGLLEQALLDLAELIGRLP